MYIIQIYIHTWKYKDNITYSAPWNNLGPLTISNDDIYKYIKLYDPKDYQVENELEQNQINLKEHHMKILDIIIIVIYILYINVLI